jgi:hypothetical protein
MEKIIPVVTTLLGLAALFFAVYYGAVERYAKLGIESVKSFGELPKNSRLDATKVIVNVFDLDVKSLTPEQQFQLALKTFEKRQTDSQRSFHLLLIGGLFFLVFSAVYAFTNINGGTMVQSALLVDKTRAIKALNDANFYETMDKSLVDKLAASAELDRSLDDPFEQVSQFESKLKKLPTVVELRERAVESRAPFEIAGQILKASVPQGTDQPPRYLAFVKHGSGLGGQTLSIRVRGRENNLVLYASPGITSDSPTDILLNYDQYFWLVGHKPLGLEKIMVTPVKEADIFDPVCPKRPGFSVDTCRLPARVKIGQVPKLR